MYVDPAHRGKGVNQKIITALKNGQPKETLMN
jgi:GNAT superfamily N-acetyltransferase